MSPNAENDEQALAEGDDAPEAGVPADLLDLYIDCERIAAARGMDVDAVLAEVRELAGGDK